MNTTHSAQFYDGHYEFQEEDLMPFVDEKTEEEFLDNYDEPGYFFKGAVFGLFFCLPFWAMLFWLAF